jgi:hypothetical protein
MKKIVIAALALTMLSTVADARPRHHRVCFVRHHHRVCHWR